MNKLEEFQKKNGLVSDGILGKKTLRKTAKYMGANRYPSFSLCRANLTRDGQL